MPTGSKLLTFLIYNSVIYDVYLAPEVKFYQYLESSVPKTLVSIKEL